LQRGSTFREKQILRFADASLQLIAMGCNSTFTDSGTPTVSTAERPDWWIDGEAGTTSGAKPGRCLRHHFSEEIHQSCCTTKDETVGLFGQDDEYGLGIDQWTG
jgi:hypothetical protein